MKNIERHCRLCKLFSCPGKVMVLQELAAGERTVSELVKRTGISQSNVSQYLAAMKAQELLHSRREGRYIHYSLAYPELGDALRIFSRIAEGKKRGGDKIEASDNDDD